MITPNAVAEIQKALPPFPEAKLRADLERQEIPFPQAEIPQAFFKFFALMAMQGDLKGKRLLDIGCGSGALVAQARILGMDAIGLDLFGEHDGRSREIAKAVSRSYGFDEATSERSLIRADAASLDATFTGQFDFSISLGMLEHVHGDAARRRIAQSMVRVLRPGGLALLVCGPNRRFPVDLFHYGPRFPFYHWFSDSGKARYLRWFVHGDLCQDPTWLNGMSVSQIAADMASEVPGTTVEQYFPELVRTSNAPLKPLAVAVAKLLSFFKAEPVVFLVARRPG